LGSEVGDSSLARSEVVDSIRARSA
jgi:hypothetical protein